MARHLIASNATIKAIRPGDARQRLTDGAGLYLRLFVNGGSHGWRLDYSLHGRRNTLSLGTYPDTSLAQARKKADDVRELVRQGIDPSALRKEVRREQALDRNERQRADQGLPPTGSFEAVEREWYDKHASGWASSHASKIIRRLEMDVFPWIGAKPVASIFPMDLLDVLKRVEARGAIETTHRVQQNCGQVFRCAVATWMPQQADLGPTSASEGQLPGAAANSPSRPEAVLRERPLCHRNCERQI
jgi:hypothetical protein